MIRRWIRDETVKHGIYTVAGEIAVALPGLASEFPRRPPSFRHSEIDDTEPTDSKCSWPPMRVRVSHRLVTPLRFLRATNFANCYCVTICSRQEYAAARSYLPVTRDRASGSILERTDVFTSRFESLEINLPPRCSLLSSGCRGN